MHGSPQFRRRTDFAALLLTNNFQHIEKILRIFIDNLVIQIPLKFEVDRIKIVPDTASLVEKCSFDITRCKVKSTYLLPEVFDTEGCVALKKIHLRTRPFVLYF